MANPAPHAGGFVRRRALRRILRQSSLPCLLLACLCLPLSSPVKLECDLPLILFNELPINEGNSRQRWKRFVIQDLRPSIRVALPSPFIFFPFCSVAVTEHASSDFDSPRYFAKSWFPTKRNDYSDRRDKLRTPLFLHPTIYRRPWALESDQDAFWIAIAKSMGYLLGYSRNGLKINIKAAERYIKF